MRTPQLATRSVNVIAAALLLAVAAGAAAPVTAAAVARPAPSGPAASFTAIRGQLYGVAASSARHAWAVGSVGTTHPRILIVHWNGKTWKRMPGPGPAGSILRGVAATSARSAWAVGCSSCYTSRPRALIVHWNGRAWKRVPSPGGSLSGVAAISVRNAWAVGSAASGRTLIVHWNGRAWRRVPSPSPSSARYGNSLAGVAAASARTVWAVGYTATGSGTGVHFKSLILRWNGRAWRRVPSPSVSSGRFGNALAGVAATSATSAWAVGCTDGCPVGGTPLIERWRGKSWKQVAAPTTPYALYNLGAVAATSATSAWAVGGGGPVTSEGTATVHWNGRRWTLSHGRSGAVLTGVTAISATNAWAVGGTASGHTLILHWNGTTWKLS
ncbi:MAG: hypothetical protein ACLQDY_00605 [Streptosporangiaceae bacterium]